MHLVQVYFILSLKVVQNGVIDRSHNSTALFRSHHKVIRLSFEWFIKFSNDFYFFSLIVQFDYVLNVSKWKYFIAVSYKMKLLRANSRELFFVMNFHDLDVFKLPAKILWYDAVLITYNFRFSQNVDSVALCLSHPQTKACDDGQHTLVLRCFNW